MAESNYLGTGIVLSIGRTTAATRDYWTKAYFENRKETRLIFGLRVELLELKNPPAKKVRQYFKILEGFYKLKVAYVKYPYSKSTLVTPPRYKPAVKIVLDLDKQSMTINGGVAFNAFSGSGKKHTKIYTQLKRGTHKIAIPNYPHGAARAAYNRMTKHMNIWFRLGGKLSTRFLHGGVISEGCATVRQFIWNPKEVTGPNGKISVRPIPPEGFNFRSTNKTHDIKAEYYDPKEARNMLGIPFPLEKDIKPIKQWQKLVDTILLCRGSDGKSIGFMVVK